LGWFAVTGSERCRHGFNGRIAGVCGVGSILCSFKGGLPRRWKRCATQNRSFFAACEILPFPNVLVVQVGISGSRRRTGVPAPHGQRPHPNVEEHSTLGWGTLLFNLLFDWRYEPSGACSTRKVLPPFDQTRIRASFPLGTLPSAC